MSELKVASLFEFEKVLKGKSNKLFYAKANVDKVIADLEESHKMEVEQLLIEIAELQKQVHDYAQGLYAIQARAEKELRRHKYKRCLRNAEGCKNKAWFYGEVRDRNAAKTMWKWRKRWLELAKKFKG